MQDITFESLDGTNLVGKLETPEIETSHVVILAHGFTSSMDRPRYDRLGKDLTANGYAFFRFDFGGSGTSGDRPITARAQVLDLKAAVALMKERGYKTISILGGSYGGLTALIAWNTDIDVLILKAPVTAPLSLDFLGANAQQEIETNGNIILPTKDRDHVITQDYIDEWEQLDFAGILKNIAIPTLIVHGDHDDEVPVEHSKHAITFLPEGSHLEIISGGDHSLDAHHEQVFTLIRNWLSVHVNS